MAAPHHGHARPAAHPRPAPRALAESYAREVIRLGTDATGTELSPMRNAEARITLGVISARHGDLETAIDYGQRALAGQRLSVPSLLMVSSELGTVLTQRYGSDPSAADYLDQLRHLRQTATATIPK